MLRHPNVGVRGGTAHGACLACFIENRPGVMTERLEGLLEEFRALPVLKTPGGEPGIGKAKGATS